MKKPLICDIPFAQRLAQQLNGKPGQEVYNSMRQQYDWSRESNQKRAIR